MKDCKEIETCLECSAEKLVFVGEVFYYALKAVVHPTGPLFDATAQGGQGALTPLCVKALKRIFLMCDLDRVRSPFRCISGPGLRFGAARPRASATSARDPFSVTRCCWPDVRALLCVVKGMHCPWCPHRRACVLARRTAR